MTSSSANNAPMEADKTSATANDTAATGSGENCLGDPELWVDEYGDYLFRYALVRLRDESLAEDLVQDTFLAAFRAKDKFAGLASPKSWLVGILKNKIADYFRKASRETSFTDLAFLKDEQSEKFIPDGLFKDGWIHERGPLEWAPDPGADLDKQAFWKTFHDCAGKLPKNISHVFMLREVEDISSEEVCAIMNISPNNLWVMLHRARMGLRQCLETNWFAKLDGKA